MARRTKVGWGVESLLSYIISSEIAILLFTDANGLRNDIVTVDVSESQILALRDKQIFEFVAELPDLFSKRFL